MTLAPILLQTACTDPHVLIRIWSYQLAYEKFSRSLAETTCSYPASNLKIFCSCFQSGEETVFFLALSAGLIKDIISLIQASLTHIFGQLWL